MSWVDRYHVVLAVDALVAGLLLVAVDRWVPAIGSRLVAIAGVVAALLGGWGSDRVWLWWVLAVVLVALPDDRSTDHEHPLGRWVGVLAVAGLVGVWVAVPDTEPALAAAMVLAPMAVVQASSGRSVGRVGTAALVVAVLGAVWVGSAGWGSALAAVCAVGAVAVAPLVLGFGGRLAGPALVWLAGTHLLVALAVPRLVMRWTTPAAWTVSLLSLLAIAAVAATVGRRRDGSVLRRG